MVGCHYEPATSLRASPTVIANEVKQSRNKNVILNGAKRNEESQTLS